MWMLHFAYAQRSVQHDKCGVIPNALFCHSERERGIQCVDASLRLRFAQHDKCGVIPNAVRNPVHGCFASLSMTKATVSFRTLFFVIPSESEESSAMRMLHFAQHDKVVSFRTQ